MPKIKKWPGAHLLRQPQIPGKKVYSDSWRIGLYRWHHRIGLIVLSVILLWLVSGLSYVLMTPLFKPEMARSEAAPPWTDQPQGLSLQALAAQNNIKSLRNFRYVTIENRIYYQIKDIYNRLQYYEAHTGKPLPDGDRVYATFLARYFSGDQTSPVTLTYLKDFTGEYPAAHQLLPVYQVSFNRYDGLQVFVETEHSRLSTHHTVGQSAALWIYDTLHQGAFLNLVTPDTLLVMFQSLLLSIIFLFSLSGLLLYGLWWKRFRVILMPHNKENTPGKYHRLIGLAVACLTLIFTINLAFQHFTASAPDDRLRFVKNSVFGLNELVVDTHQLPWQRTQAQNASLIAMPQGIFYQLFGKDDAGQPKTFYVNAETGEELEEGDFIYARYLANKFKAHKANIDAGVSFSCCLPPDTIPDGTQIAKANIIGTQLITKFDEVYGSENKRLPVVKVSYGTSDRITYYIETSSSRQALRVTDPDRIHDNVWKSRTGSAQYGTPIPFAFLGMLAIALLGLTIYLKS